MTNPPPPHVLIVLDGWGHREDVEANAIALAKTPTWDHLWKQAPHCLISSSGLDVGLPDGQMGNSEVGHMSLGAGRVIEQNFTRISNAIADRSFFENAPLKSTFRQLADSGRSLHLFGLLSRGGVHSHEDHIHAAVQMAFENGVKTIYMHAFLDGRDVSPKSALDSLVKLNDYIQQNGDGGIASIVGRYYAMDRDNRWQRIKPAYNLVAHGISDYTAESPEKALQDAYDRGESDEFVKPTSVLISGEKTRIADQDAVIFMNFRSDRARQISRAFTDLDFTKFERHNHPQLSGFTTLTQYSDNIDAQVIFAPVNLDNGLGELVSKQGLRQLRLAETEKYAHVTFFFSGGREATFPHEDRILIPSPKIATYDLQPSMSALEVTNELVKAIESGEYHLIICNYANGDMVGHTGDLTAAISAAEYVDQCLARILPALESQDGHCLITADHGNLEQMMDDATGQPHTAHTSELVPLVYVGSKKVALTITGGTLCDIAPTLVALMELEQPKEMTGTSLVTMECEENSK